MSLSARKPNSRVVTLVAVSAIVFLGSTTARADRKLDQQVEKAMYAVFNGPTIKKLKVNNHEFNVKKAQVVRSGDVVILEGTISHHLSFRKDDQVRYKIRKQRGAIKEMSIKIDRGGFAPIGAWVVNVLGKYVTGVPMPVEKVESLARKLGQKIDGKWESTAELLVTNIAMRVNSRGRDGLMVYRASLQQGTSTTVSSGRTPLSRPAASGKTSRDHRS